jgi:uncharacterized protein (DUF934 family)
MLLLLEDGRSVEDTWTMVAEEAGSLPPDGPVIVGLEFWRTRRQELAARHGALGIRLQSNQHADGIAADLARFALVALEFPRFRDGRAFSTARDLRERHGFAGEIRAVGHILPDQAQFLVRTGFTSAALPEGARLETWRQALGEISIAYQSGRIAEQPLSLLRRRIVNLGDS